MRIHKSEIPVRIGVGGSTVRHEYDFGTVSGYETFAGEHYSIGANSDFTPLLQGLEDDMCQCPHWGYVITGEMEVKYTSGETETYATGDLFYMPHGHTLIVTQDSECVMFSPQKEHCVVVEHIKEKLAAMT